VGFLEPLEVHLELVELAQCAPVLGLELLHLARELLELLALARDSLLDRLDAFADGAKLAQLDSDVGDARLRLGVGLPQVTIFVGGHVGQRGYVGLQVGREGVALGN